MPGALRRPHRVTESTKAGNPGPLLFSPSSIRIATIRQPDAALLHHMKLHPTLLAIALLSIIPTSALANNAGYLEVKRDDKTVLTMRFSEGSLKFFDEVPTQLTAVLRERGIDCCLAHTRVSETVWKCCHGKYSLISSSARIQNVLSAAFNEPKVVQR